MPTIKIEGMSCGNCTMAVTKALGAMPGLTDVRVTLEPGSASWVDQDPGRPVDLEKVKEAVRDLGFEA
ncbi:MAG: cation transporter [Deltaproteobacteria bacterium]|nr:cation transporter [Deltaproteobacteria bacterium]